MAKNEPTRPDVVWTLINDGMKPKPAPFGFVVQNPFARAIPPSAKMEIKLGVAASVPLLVWPRGDMKDYVTTPLFVPAGTQLSVVVENKSAHSPLMLEDREVLVNIHPLIFTGTAEVG